MASKCRVYQDSIGLFVKHGFYKGRPQAGTPTAFWEGDTILKHRHPQTALLRIQNLSGTITERWAIYDEEV